MFHPSYNCQRITRDLDITGRVDDPLWQHAAIAELTEPTTGEPHALGTTARMLYNDRYLYLGFHCQDDYIQATLTAHDAEVWTEGCCEAFLCPSDKMRQYYEINVNPLNTVFDTFILNGRENMSSPWTCTSLIDYTCDGLITRVHVDGEIGVVGGVTGWTAEYAIPFTALIGADHLVPEPGDRWRMNLCRIGSAPAQEDMRYYAWATIGAVNFHTPWQFGTLCFGGTIA
ncbi:MAG TPA: carbohydrate-binding family 9-like protein [Armatimonadota bacterium]|jgi:hypothetical protein